MPDVKPWLIVTKAELEAGLAVHWTEGDEIVLQHREFVVIRKLTEDSYIVENPDVPRFTTPRS